ncbi:MULTISPECIES: SHOCT domain-containing protein [unclassified Streptomyces]|uniref:SHOCT domain-containing protein n=1 Tax=unclassified Streptomyces TaxID=2593676 RepID=UPI002DD872D5|nr:SHOCT domain-containing protein [Streptomyces sp. NBC_01445]WSE09701.1 SHOCT domain-containing protein [Streptomyces sp. NBC_01445]
MPQRFGRPGLLGTIARTAVISGTATAVSSRVDRRIGERDVRRQTESQAAQQQAAAEQPPPQQPAAPPATDRVSQLTALAELKAQGLLTDEEFAAEKARVLNS